MNLRSHQLLPVAIVALMCGSAPTLWASHQCDHHDDGAAHDPNDDEILVASHVQRDGVFEDISAGDSRRAVPDRPGSGDGQEECGLVIREGDVPVFDNVPCIEPIRLPPLSSLTPNR